MPLVLLLIIAGTLGYAWLLFPLWLVRAARRAPLEPAPEEPLPERPRIAVLIAAHNEAEVIEARVTNLKTVDYPADRIRFLIGCDGSSDETALRAQRAAGSDVRFDIQAFPRNEGKVATLLKLFARTAASDELLVMSDANTTFAPTAIARLADHFARQEIGGVCGRLIFTAGGHDNPCEEGRYWRWETRLKQAESRLDSCLGANGAIYALRRQLFWQAIPTNTIVDDFVLGMKVREQGDRMLYDPTAIAYEELPPVSSEWGRRVRIGAGDYQALGLCRRALSPTCGTFAWCFFSHKLLRWFTPHLLVALAGVALWGAWTAEGAGRYGWLGLLALYLLGAVGAMARRSAWRHFVTMQLALLCGFIRYIRGPLAGTWQRTARG